MSSYIVGLTVGEVFVLTKEHKVVPIEEHKRPIVANKSKDSHYNKPPKIDWVNRRWE